MQFQGKQPESHGTPIEFTGQPKGISRSTYRFNENQLNLKQAFRKAFTIDLLACLLAYLLTYLLTCLLENCR